MKKLFFLLVIGMLLLPVAVFAQNGQGVNPEDFGRGGFSGPVLTPMTIEDLLNTVPNQFVIVEGYLVQQRIPGTYILADAPSDYWISVVIRLSSYGWANLNIDPSTPVLVYGNVNRSDMRIEIEATRIEVKK